MPREIIDTAADLDDLLDEHEQEQQPEPEQKQKIIIKEKIKEPEDPEKHRELVLTVSRYGQNERFREYLSDKFKFDHLESKSVKELESQLQSIKSALANRNTSGLLGHAVFAGLGIVEKVPHMLKMSDTIDLAGLTELCRNDSSILDDIAELECCMGDVTQLPPEKRLLLSITMATVRVAAINKIKKTRTAMRPNNVAE